MKAIRLFTHIILTGICLLSLLIIYANFDTEVGSLGNQSILYYLISGFTLVTLIGLFWLPDGIKTNVALLLISMICSVYLAELFFFLRRTNPNLSAHALAARQLNIPFDTRSKLEVIEDYNEEGIEALPAINPFKVDGLFPLGGVSNTLTVACNEMGEYLIYESDEHGFHNPKGLYNTGDVSIMAVGDSFTHGSCVKSEENAISLIREVYPHTINLGRSGSGPLRLLGTLREYAKPLEPDIVLWIYTEANDLSDLNREKKDSRLVNYIEANYSQDLLSIQPDIDNKLKILFETEKEKALTRENEYSTPFLKYISIGHLREKMMSILIPQLIDFDLELFRNVLMVAQQDVSEWGGTLYFVYLPSSARAYNPNSNHSYRQQVLQIVADLNITLIDVQQEMIAHPEPLTLFPFQRGHYNAEGYKLFGDTVLDFLEENYPPQ
ncbi:MAG: hypothetical protein AAF485_15415 [Chloroflexota bacterium]